MSRSLQENNYSVSRIRVNRSATYETYILVLNEVIAAKNELWNREAQKYYGVDFKFLDRLSKRSIARRVSIWIEDQGYPDSPYAH